MVLNKLYVIVGVYCYGLNEILVCQNKVFVFFICSLY